MTGPTTRLDSRPRMVSIGDSLTAGMRNGNLDGEDTVTSFPSLIADKVDISHEDAQLSGSLVTPIFKDGWFTMRRAALHSVRNALALALPSVFARLGYEAPAWSFFPAGYMAGVPFDQPSDNLGVPGLKVHELDSIRGTDELLEQREQGKNSDIIAMQSPLIRGFCNHNSKTILDRAVEASPDVITLGIGGNDVIEAALTGRVDDKTLIPVEDKVWEYTELGPEGKPVECRSATVKPGFRTQFNQAVDKLLSRTDAEIMVLNLVDVTKMPILRTVGQPIAGLPFSIANFAGRDITTDFEATQISDKVKGEGEDGRTQFPAGTKVSMLTLLGDAASGRLGRDFREDQVLDPEEAETVSQRIADMNRVIAEKATSSPRVHLVDIHSVIEQANQPEGVKLRGQGEVALGGGFFENEERPGLFSLDGIHPADVGYGIVANRVIETAKKAAATRPKLRAFAEAKEVDEVALFRKELNRVRPQPPKNTGEV